MFALVVAACGPSSGQIRAAKQAHYDTDAQTVFAAALDVAKATYDVRDYDERQLGLETGERWFDAEGTAQGRGTEDHPANASDNMVVLSFVIRVSGEDHAWTIDIEPEAYRLVSWSSELQNVGSGDMPSWVRDKIDDLYLKIHAKLAAYEAKPAAK